MSKLSSRQVKLYNFLLDNVNRYVGEPEIALSVYGSVSTKNFHDSQERQLLTSDIQVLNKSDEVDKIIMSTSQGIKIATEYEIRGYLSREYASIFRKLKRARIKSKKVGLNKQKEFIFDDETTSERFIDAFVGNSVLHLFEKGKRYIFRARLVGRGFDSWTKTIDGREVAIHSSTDGSVGLLSISPEWCEELREENI